MNVQKKKKNRYWFSFQSKHVTVVFRLFLKFIFYISDLPAKGWRPIQGGARPPPPTAGTGSSRHLLPKVGKKREQKMDA